MSLSQETCLLCFTVNKNTINFYSDQGRELNIISILSTHFWFQLDEIKVLSQNICCECWKKTESFHEFYQTIRIAHKKFETVFVKIENELDIKDNYGEEIYQPVQVSQDNFVTEFLKYGNSHDPDDDESSNTSVCEIPCTNSIDTETRAFNDLPKKTQDKYLQAYSKLQTWKASQNIDKECFSEAVMLEYFHYLKTKYNGNSLYAQYSMLRTTIQRKDKVNITYPEITSLLKNNKVHVVEKVKATVFQPDELRRFFAEAQDIEYLAAKVIMIFMIYGITRTDDLTKVEVNDVTQQGSVFVVKYTERKKNVIRSFTVENEYAAYVKKYKQLRPANVAHDRFFLNYQKGKCTVQPIGKNKFLHTPKIIANFLKLEGAENYTCYSFRRESLKRNRGMRSSKSNRKIGDRNLEQSNFERSTITSSIDSSTAEIATIDPNDIREGIENDSCSENTQKKYRRAYEKFMAWKVNEEIDEESFSEAVMLEYFNYLKIKYKPNSLFAEYSMLRATIQTNHNIDICYPEIKSLLKWSKFGHVPQKVLVFQMDEIQRFFCEAQDHEFLGIKVIMIFGIFDVTTEQFLNVNVNDVCEQGSVFVVKIPEAKTNTTRSFILEYEYAACVRKYIELRPEKVTHNLFFLTYYNGRCLLEPTGRNRFMKAPKTIAHFLNLKDPESYTIQSFRRDSLKRSRGMRSSNVLNSYIEECLPKMRKTADIKSDQINCETSNGAIVTNSIDTSIVAIPSSITTTSAAWNLLPEKSRERYVRSYDKFVAWKISEKVDKECFSEAIMLGYFNYLNTKYKPSSLWSEYSMLRLTIKKHNNVDICYPEVTSLLKKSSIGFVPQKTRSNVFQPDELQRFLQEAEDDKYLAVKVIMIFGIYGATSADELTKVEVNDVSDEGSVITIKIPDTKTNGIRTFNVENEYAEYVRKYKKLRPTHARHRRFFLKYHNGKCTVQPIGKHKFLSATKVIANFLNLEDSDNYTGNSFKRTSKKFIADNGGDLLNTKLGGSSSSAVEEGQVSKKEKPCTFTSAMDTSAVANALSIPHTFQTTFQAYNVQPHPIQPYPPLPYGTNPITIPTTVQTYHIQPHQIQPYPPLPYGTMQSNQYLK